MVISLIGLYLAYKIMEGNMEEGYRNNIIDFSLIYLNKDIEGLEYDTLEFGGEEFTQYVFKQLFNIDINESGYGLDNSTKQMTNDIGDLKIYNEDDEQKISYLLDIKRGDLVFFHTKSLEANSPTPSNHYPGHTGIYLGNNEFIHVSPIENKVIIERLENSWLNCLVASRDIIKEIIKTM